jgi:hypothetical protein
MKYHKSSFFEIPIIFLLYHLKNFVWQNGVSLKVFHVNYTLIKPLSYLFIPS